MRKSPAIANFLKRTFSRSQSFSAMLVCVVAQSSRQTGTLIIVRARTHRQTDKRHLSLSRLQRERCAAAAAAAVANANMRLSPLAVTPA